MSPSETRRGLVLWGGLRIDDSGDTVSISPRGIPSGVMWVFFGLPLILPGPLFAYLAIVRHDVEWTILLAIPIGILPLLIVALILRTLNRAGGAGEPLAILNRRERTLLLCDEGAVLLPTSVQGLEIRTRWKVTPLSGEWHLIRLTELLARSQSPDGAETRRCLVAGMRRKQIARFAGEVAQVLEAELRAV